MNDFLKDQRIFTNHMGSDPTHSVIIQQGFPIHTSKAISLWVQVGLSFCSPGLHELN